MTQKKHTNGTGKPRGFQPGNKFGNKIKPGEVRNPGGRPKSRHISKAGREFLAANAPEDPMRTNAEIIIESIGALAKGGDLDAAKWLADRTEGQAVKQTIDLSADEWQRNMLETVNAEVARLVEEGWSEAEARAIVLEADPQAAEWLQ